MQMTIEEIAVTVNGKKKKRIVERYEVDCMNDKGIPRIPEAVPHLFHGEEILRTTSGEIHIIKVLLSYIINLTNRRFSNILTIVSPYSEC